MDDSCYYAYGKIGIFYYNLLGDINLNTGKL